MGGHAGGQEASATAVRVIGQRISDEYNVLVDLAKEGETWEVQAVLETAVQAANEAVCAMAAANPELKDMGTTASVLWICGNSATIAHVGDSRIYLIRDGEAHVMTQDHSLLVELVKQGRMTQEEADGFPYPNAISRRLGSAEGVEVDTFEFGLLSGDRLLVCSDGLYRFLDEGEVAPRLMSGPVEEVAPKLVQLAIQGGGDDNITAVLLAVGEVPATDDTRRKIEIFEGMPLFLGLSHRQILRVLAATSMRHFQTDQMVFEEGMLGDELFVILSGEVEVNKNGIVMATLDAGDAFGEMALVDESPRSANVRATLPTRMLVLTRDRLYATMGQDADLGLKLLWNFLQMTIDRLRDTSQQLLCVKQEQRAKEPRPSRPVPTGLSFRRSG
ncbi:MAG: hypothetical protein A3K19_23350 [Lentisphaerae bacterium RIFOXYB12_FULL_65_16]|nr:MAG: hypothetical protein A3K18_26305 [Lentisphaerae bacterium RIFOXYA12_64_32]OGV87513.1 MAG: hypothetical protein A3K19_23350 [Lentisphaerae bacterium RIFOXYB12_FULL_65_16]